MKALSFVLVGHPVGHSMSPAIHGEVYRHFGLPHRYEAVDCPDEASVARVVERLRGREIAGFNVTVPWKRLALRLADRVDTSARETGAANTLLLDQEGQVIAHNTDVPALAERLAAQPGQPERAVVLGNGGAALAAVAACRQLNVGPISVSARAWQQAAARDTWRDCAEFEQLGAQVVAWDKHPASELQRAFSGAQLVVQATSAGMAGKGGGEELAQVLPWEQLRPDCFLCDVVYNPPVTPFIHHAQQRGLRCESGLPMLVGQAALAIQLWLGIEAPRAQMTAVAERLLGGRGA